MSDVIVVGGGVIGLSVAYELAGRGRRVLLLEQGQIGQEASWAGAGMLPPGNPQFARTPEAVLRAHSHVRWCSLSNELFELTGIDNGYRRSGGLEICFERTLEQFEPEIAVWREEGVEVEPLDAADLRKLEPAISPAVRAGYRLPTMAQIRNPRHLKALTAACARRGVEFRTGTPVLSFERQGERVVGVRTPLERIFADQVVVTTGSWTAALLSDVGCEIELQPIRGQITLLSLPSPPFTHLLNVGPRYLVARPDGRILIGATEERCGFDKRNTASAVGGLLTFGTQVVPQLASAKFERAWAGLRPRTSDDLPYLGAVPGMSNLFIAAGHFRSGLQMSAITGVVMTQLLLGEPTEFPLTPFACERGLRKSSS